MSKEHQYKATIKWTGNTGAGTIDYKSYERSHLIQIEDKPVIHGSSDVAFRGDRTCHNPEDLLLSSLSSCHMLWYLHLCAVNKIIVLKYIDHATGTMKENENGSGAFVEVVLRPKVIVKTHEMVALAESLHIQANEMCFIANSVYFPVKHKPEIQVSE